MATNINNIDELKRLIEDEIVNNLEIDIVQEDTSYEPYNSYRAILIYKEKVISRSDTISVPL